MVIFDKASFIAVGKKPFAYPVEEKLIQPHLEGLQALQKYRQG